MTYRYYLLHDPLTGKPWLLFRELDGDPEQDVMSAGSGWIRTSNLWLRRANGEITENDRLSEEVAAAIAAAWGHDLGT